MPSPVRRSCPSHRWCRPAVPAVPAGPAVTEEEPGRVAAGPALTAVAAIDPSGAGAAVAADAVIAVAAGAAGPAVTGRIDIGAAGAAFTADAVVGEPAGAALTERIGSAVAAVAEENAARVAIGLRQVPPPTPSAPLPISSGPPSDSEMLLMKLSY